jgi:hypothetical protein
MPTGTHELNSEIRDGRTITLSYDFDNLQSIVSVKSPNEDFTLYPADFQALDVFYHPYFYADVALKRGTLSVAA